MKNPALTVDIIIETEGGIVLIERKNAPFGWALPGGFVDEGESLESAALREAREETALEPELADLLYIYSNPARDQRRHTVSAVFIASASGTPVGGDDARLARVFSLDELPDNLAFDHAEILADYWRLKETGKYPDPGEMLERCQK